MILESLHGLRYQLLGSLFLHQEIIPLVSKCSLLSTLNLLSHSSWLGCLELKEKLSKQH